MLMFQWVIVLDSFRDHDNVIYGFVLPDKNPAKAKDALGLDIPMMLHMGDFDMDGFADIVLLLRPVNTDK